MNCYKNNVDITMGNAKRKHEIFKTNYNKIVAHRFQPGWTLLFHVDKKASNIGIVWTITQETKPQRSKADSSYFL